MEIWKCNPHRFIVYLLVFPTLACLPLVSPISLPEIHGWHLDTLHAIGDHRLELRQHGRDDGMWVSQTTQNLQQCLRLCWLYAACGVITYSTTNAGGGPSTCRLFEHEDHRYVTKVSDSSAMIVNMTRAVMKKARPVGCDQRPCGNNELCVTVRSHDMYQCLPLASTTCGAAPSFQFDNARSTIDGLGFAHFKCNDGFASTPENGVTSECLKATGQWSAASLSCQYVDCKIPPVLGGAEVRYTGTHLGAMSTYTCYTGHYSPSETNMTVRCERSGKWSDSPHPCTLVDCGHPKAIENGQVELLEPDSSAIHVGPAAAAGDTRTFYGGFATHTCLEGYESPSTSVQSTCQHDGQWSVLPTSFQCNPLDCGQPPSFDLANETFTTTTYLSKVSYSCVDGYSSANVPVPDRDVVSDETSQCQNNGSWSSINVTCLPVDCGAVPDFHGINITANSSTYGSIAYVKCSDTNHLFKGRDQVTCNASGLWSESNASCTGPPCATPNPVANSTVAVKTTDDDKYIAVYTSLPGFLFNSGEPSEFRTCVKGTWTGFPDLQSIPVNCGPPPPLPNADLLAPAQYSYQSKAAYTCREGFQNTTDANHITCLGNGSWSPEQFYCSRIVCGKPPSVMNSKNNNNMSFQSDTYYDYGDTIVYECEDGFSLTTSNDTISCTGVGWETAARIECIRTQCGPPPLVQNASYVIDGDTVLYSCDEAFVLKDASVSKRICRRDVWSEEEVVCVSDRCLDPPGVENATPIFNSTTRDSVVTYTCKDGFRLTTGAVNQRRCQENRMWSTENVTCHPEKCGTAPMILNTDVSYKMNNSNGSVATYRCKPGFVLPAQLDTTSINSIFMDEEPVLIDLPFDVPETVIETVTKTLPKTLEVVSEPVTDYVWRATCNKSSQWTSDANQPESCTPVVCGNPPVVEHAEFTKPNSNTFGNVVEYTCVRGFVLVSTGMNIKTCGASKTWEGDVECKIIGCLNDAQPVANAKMEAEGVKPGDTAVYICNEGFAHSWFDKKVCLENGTWSNPQIQCRIIDCGPPPVLEHAQVKFENTVYGSQARYNCQGPYVLLFLIRIKKCRNFFWGSQYLKCIHKRTKPCKKLTIPAQYTHFTDGGLAEVSCLEGYTLRTAKAYNNGTRIPKDNIKVCRDGAWTGEDITCQPVECGLYPDIKHAEGTVSEYTYRSQVVYVCLPGYVLAGLNSKTCMADGHWSNDAVECVQPDVVYCPSLGKMDRTISHFESYVVGSKAIYICIEGYINNSKEVECLSTGSWSSLEDFKCVPVDCHSPPVIKNTNVHVHVTSFGHHAIYTCSLYNLDDETRTSRSQCQANATWSHVDIPCFHCSAPPQPPNTANHAQTNKLYNIDDIVSFNCSEGYTAYPYDTIIQTKCSQGGEWSRNGSDSHCVPEICMDISSLNATYIVHVDNVDTNHSQILAHYHCMDGHFIQDHSHTDRAPIICDFTKGWLTDSLFPCLPVDCGAPSVMANAIGFASSTTYLSETVYDCDVPSTPKGSVLTSVCLANGTWSPVDLRCVLCSTDIPITNGRLQERYNENYEEAIVVCDDGYLLYSNNGLVNDVVTCGQGTEYQWDYLDTLDCIQNRWINPMDNENIRLDQSYGSYNISFNVSNPEFERMSSMLLAYQGTTIAYAFGLVTYKQFSQIDLIQRGFDGENFKRTMDFDVHHFGDRTRHDIIIEVVTDTMMYRVWIDGEYIGGMDNVQIPLSDVRTFLFGTGSSELLSLRITPQSQELIR